jgi:hypothetical protein
MRKMLRLPSPAMAVSVTALVVALGGTSYAAVTLKANSVGTKQLKNGAVTTPKIANGAVTTPKIANGAVTTPKIANGAVTGAKVLDGSLTTADLAASAQAPWAIVNSAGTIVAQSGGFSAFENITGEYYVRFPSSRLDHGISVTSRWQLGDAINEVSTVLCGTPPQGATCVGPGTGTDNHWVYVQVNSNPTTEASGGFYITSTP